MKGGIVGLALDRLTNLVNCILEVTAVKGGQAEEMQGIRVSGPALKDFLKYKPRRAEASGLEVLDAGVQGVRSLIETHQHRIQWSSGGRPRR